jgi:hypothetical protein
VDLLEALEEVRRVQAASGFTGSWNPCGCEEVRTNLVDYASDQCSRVERAGSLSDYAISHWNERDVLEASEESGVDADGLRTRCRIHYICSEDGSRAKALRTHDSLMPLNCFDVSYHPPPVSPCERGSSESCEPVPDFNMPWSLSDFLEQEKEAARFIEVWFPEMAGGFYGGSSPHSYAEDMPTSMRWMFASAFALIAHNLSVLRWAWCLSYGWERGLGCTERYFDLEEGPRHLRLKYKDGDCDFGFRSIPGLGVRVCPDAIRTRHQAWACNCPKWLPESASLRNVPAGGQADVNRLQILVHLGATMAHEISHQCARGLGDWLPWARDGRCQPSWLFETTLKWGLLMKYPEAMPKKGECACVRPETFNLEETFFWNAPVSWDFTNPANCADGPERAGPCCGAL